MRIRSDAKPFKPNWFSTRSTLFLLACAATLTIWNPDPFLAWGFEIAVFALAAALCLRGLPPRLPWAWLVLPAISIWGFAQLAFGATVYRWATLNRSLEYAALAATAFCAAAALGQASARAAFLRAFVWFGFALSIASVTAYYTSPGKILWMFQSPYPDNWGPFLSRNNFAQFLELCFPAALFQMGPGVGGVIVPATILAAGFASASRAGAALLALEAVAGFWLLGRAGKAAGNRSLAAGALLVFSALIAALAGAGTLLGRLQQPHPLEYRKQIWGSAVAMTGAHPWKGFGLGTFPAVYPEFAEFDTGAAVEHAHNDWLEWACEGGIPFAALWGVFALWAVRPAIRSIWGLGVLAVFLHALMDYPFARPGVSAWAFILLGALTGTEKSLQTNQFSIGRKTLNHKAVRSAISLALTWIVALALSPSFGMAAPPVIGTAAAAGSFRVDGATVRGNATLFEGATIETEAARSTLDFSSGASVFLLPHSKGRIFGDRLVLEKGSGQIQKAENFRMEAHGLAVQPETGRASARVSLAGASRVQVAALSGPLHVLNSRGLLVATVNPGETLEFTPQSSNEPWKLTGCLRSSDGHYLLTDETAHVTVEVAGAGLNRESGNRVQIVGALDPTAAPVSGATQLIRATQIQRLGTGCAAGKAAPAAAGGPAPGSGSGHLSATVISVIGGVAAAAVIGGLAAEDTLPGQGGSSATVSR